MFPAADLAQGARKCHVRIGDHRAQHSKSSATFAMCRRWYRARDFARALELTMRFSQCNSFVSSQAKFASDINLVKRPVIFSRQERQNLFSNLTSVYSHLGETIWSGLSS